jgi:UDP-N-acetyl-D-mannosaminuronic acid dehydrogenase
VFHGARVLATDAYAIDESFVSPERLIEESDVIVLGAPHTIYRELEFPEDKEVVDVWGFLGRERMKVGVR